MTDQGTDGMQKVVKLRTCAVGSDEDEEEKWRWYRP